MPLYRKKPAVIEARRYDDLGVGRDIVYWVNTNGGQAEGPIYDLEERLLISTIEGVMAVSFGDWVIRGVAGEFYPCRNDIFEATYEAVE